MTTSEKDTKEILKRLYDLEQMVAGIKCDILGEILETQTVISLELTKIYSLLETILKEISKKD